MFILKDKETIQKASERAKALHPKVSVRRFGEYQVTGSAGALSTVRCERHGALKMVGAPRQTCGACLARTKL